MRQSAAQRKDSMDKELFDSGTNKHGTHYKVHRLGREQYIVELNYAYAGQFKSGCIALDAAQNTKLIRKIERN